MNSNSEAFKTIKIYHERFRESIENCKKAVIFNPADCEDTYARAARVRERYMEEKANSTLGPSELNALSKVFENDVFTQGMMNIRHVGEHVTKRGDFIIRTTKNEAIKLPAATSAMAMFAHSTVILNDTAGKSHHISHFELLEELKQRYDAAIKKGENS